MRHFCTRIAICSAIVLLCGAPLASAQSDEVTLVPDSEGIDEIIVTGSRIRRDTYSSIAPLQIITAKSAREAGLQDATAILQESIAATGNQTDLTTGYRVIENGPGASTISLRGLGQERTLMLVNGRRIGPAGVEGAPTSADLGLVPASLVAQYDLLLDGASSIYGSDAVAGVTNIILRRDFDGFEAQYFTGIPQQSNGVENTFTLSWGKNFERGFVGVGAEYRKNDPITFKDRRWLAGCTKNIEIDETGTIRNTDYRTQYLHGMEPDECSPSTWVGRMNIDNLNWYVSGFDAGHQQVYYTPGSTNIGIPNFSDGHETYLRGGLDSNGDGVTDIAYADYSFEPLIGDRQLMPDFERWSVMTYGEYSLSVKPDLTAFFEIQYSKRKVLGDAGQLFLITSVPQDNLFNPCNPNGLDGVDCFLARNDFLARPEIIDGYIAEYGAPPQAVGLGLNPPAGALGVTTFTAIEGDRTTSDVELAQTRVVAGIRGDLPGFGTEFFDGWQFELAMVASHSFGTSVRPGIREDRLQESFETTAVDPSTGELVCGADGNGDGIPDGIDARGQACIPVNMFAHSLLADLPGNFATQAERDYLFDTRHFETTYRQHLINAYVEGDLFKLPTGKVAAVFGFEFREDEIRSIPDEVARDGLFANFFADGGAVGEKFTREFFAEMEIPLLTEAPAARELVLNLSGRHTDDEFFGSDITYAAKLGWRPTDTLLLRATTGTSFRAPNLRENFFEAQQFINYQLDPCVAPADAYNPLTGYDPALDSREAHVLQNCVNSGVDPTSWLFPGINYYIVDFSTGGNEGLIAETSDSLSLGFVWDQDIFESFDFTIGASYYEVDIANTIIAPSPEFIVSDCYNSVELNSVLCPRITRDPVYQYIRHVSTDFINRDQFLVTGFDVNAGFNKSLDMFGRAVDLSATLVLNHPREASETYTNEEGAVDFADQAGEWGYPDWIGSLTLAFDLNDYRLTWRTRFIGFVQQDPLGADEWSDVTGGSHTCLGPTMNDVLCRDVDYANDYYVHSMSLYRQGDTWSIGGGIRNVFNEPPPQVDATEVDAIRNSPIGFGYDLNGRTYFVHLQVRF